MLSKEKLINLYRKSKNNKNVLDSLFNPSKNCFSCLLLSEMTLEDVCKLKSLNLDSILSQLS